jgi:DNA-binding XRE family transcriptional regulator
MDHNTMNTTEITTTTTNQHTTTNEQATTPTMEATKKAKRGPKPKNRPELRLEVLMAAAGIRTISTFAKRAGVSRQTVHTWKHKGLNYWRADELSIKLAGLHPASVFGPIWYALDSTQMAVAA